NVEDVCRFPDLPARRQLSYQAKQLIAREIELEKMRRTEALLQARNLGEVGRVCGAIDRDKVLRAAEGILGKAGENTDMVTPNHQQRLEHIVQRVAVENKPEKDFFGRPLRRQQKTTAPAPQDSKEESIENKMGKAVGKSDVWFRFNEGDYKAV
ncbi:Chromosome transmission fidelity protein 18, partial [Nestor notabilis]